MTHLTVNIFTEYDFSSFANIVFIVDITNCKFTICFIDTNSMADDETWKLKSMAFDLYILHLSHVFDHTEYSKHL